VGEEKSARWELVNTTTHSVISSDVWSAQACMFQQGHSTAARWQGGKQEGSEEHVLSFYRGICPCAISPVRAIHAARLDKSTLASLRASPCVSAFLQVVMTIFSEARKRRQWQCRDKTSSQNHRMVGVRRDLCGSSSPTTLPKQGHLQQAAQDLVQVGLEYLQKRRLHNLPGQPVPVLRHPQREEVLPHVQMKLPLL